MFAEDHQGIPNILEVQEICHNISVLSLTDACCQNCVFKTFVLSSQGVKSLRRPFTF